MTAYGRNLLTACLDGRAERLAAFPVRSDRDWELLIQSASDEFLLPALHHRLTEIGLAPPPEVAEFLAQVDRLNDERNAQIIAETHAIAGLLNSIGIEPVALKGIAFLLTDVYPGRGSRYLCDIDLLVPRTQLRAAAEALEKEGYQPDSRDAMGHFRHHYPTLQRLRAADGSGSAPVELHHSLGHGVSKKLLSGDEMLRDSSVRTWNGVRIRIPSREHLLSHLIMHSQVHHCYGERIWPPLRSMYDLLRFARYAGSAELWYAVRSRFQERGQRGTLLLHLLQVHDKIGMPLPFDVELGYYLRARWARRKALNRFPLLRFIDPGYLVLSTLSRRLRFLRSIGSNPDGWKLAVQTLVRPGFYRRMLAEIVLR